MKIPRKKIILSIVIFIFTIVLIGGAVYLKNVADYKQAVKETTFDEINISDVSDGVYIGEYDVNFMDLLTKAKNLLEPTVVPAE